MKCFALSLYDLTILAFGFVEVGDGGDSDMLSWNLFDTCACLLSRRGNFIFMYKRYVVFVLKVAYCRLYYLFRKFGDTVGLVF